MLVRFSVENWMSFQNQASFSMIASKERQHRQRVPEIKRYKTRLLPIAAIYGGNASGKTNFFKAIYFAKRFVVQGTQPDGLIPVEPFLLDPESSQQPLRFIFELLIEETIYEFSFSVSSNAVLEEKLVRLESSSEKVLYHRLNGEPNFDRTLAKDAHLKFAFQGTRDNQLFLTNTVSQKIENFKPIYQWFRDQLFLVGPDSRFGFSEQLLNEDYSLLTWMSKRLSELDTGIGRLMMEDIALENINLPELIKLMIKERKQEGINFQILFDESILLISNGGKWIAKKLVTYHPTTDGTDAKFEIHQESDGSRRIINLLPIFLRLSDPNCKQVFLIDEIDRSLHTLLTRQLLEMYLNGCSAQTRSQLLFTTHDLYTMDQQLLRRDEMWVAQRERAGNSTLIPFSDFQDIRYDKDIRKSYLQGRLGGVPRILLERKSEPRRG